MVLARICLAIAALSAGLLAVTRTQAQIQPATSCPTVTGGSGKDPSPLIGSDNAFGFRLFKALEAEQQGSNLFISPTSVATALEMAFDGARGSTRQAMDHALSLGGNDPAFVRAEAAALQHALQNADPKVHLGLGNSVWLHKGASFQPSFMQHLRQYYAAKATTLDFHSASAPGKINSWVSCATRGTIRSLRRGSAPMPPWVRPKLTASAQLRTPTATPMWSQSPSTPGTSWTWAFQGRRLPTDTMLS